MAQRQTDDGLSQRSSLAAVREQSEWQRCTQMDLQCDLDSHRMLHDILHWEVCTAVRTKCADQGIVSSAATSASSTSS